MRTEPTELFWSKVNKGSESECWLWTGAEARGGYGKFCVTSQPGDRAKQRTWLAHRFALATRLGREPVGVVMHSCDVRTCVNPAHLREGTHAENVADMVSKHRQAFGDRVKNRACGERLKQSHLTEQDVRELRAMAASGASGAECARRFRISAVSANKIIKGKTWTHLERVRFA